MYGVLIDAMRGMANKCFDNGNGGGGDIFGGGTGVGGSMSATAINISKEALACMPVMDVEFMRRKREELSDNDAGQYDGSIQ